MYIKNIHKPIILVIYYIEIEKENINVRRLWGAGIVNCDHSVCLCVCPSVLKITANLVGMGKARTNRNFGVDPVPDVDPGSVLHFT